MLIKFRKRMRQTALLKHLTMTAFMLGAGWNNTAY